MTHSAAIPVSEELDELFKKSADGSDLRYLQVKIIEEKLVSAHTEQSTNSVEDDFNKMQSQTENEASYFLFRLEGRKWLLITYVPEGVSVKDKMVYASTKGTLKSKLGFSYFDQELHVTSKAEFTYDYFKNDKKPIDSRSDLEIVRENVAKMENEERTSRKPGGGSMLGGIGGYHSVVIPLTQSAKDSLEKLKSGTVNFVELVIDDAKENINSGTSKDVLVTQLSSELDQNEPRFYVYNYNKMGVSKIVFIYSCPEKSPPKLRMVYSTSKPQVAEQVRQLGIVLAPKKIEIRESSELTEEHLKSELSVARTPTANDYAKPMPKDGMVKSVKANVVNSPHPIYSMLDPNGRDKPKKKIVMPPSGAYGGY